MYESYFLNNDKPHKQRSISESTVRLNLLNLHNVGLAEIREVIRLENNLFNQKLESKGLKQY